MAHMYESNELGVPEKATDSESYLELMEKKKKRAERFGIGMVEVAFTGMVPTHKRYLNKVPSTGESSDVSLQLFSKDKIEKRKQRFPEANDESWLSTTFHLLRQCILKEKGAHFTDGEKLPSQSIRIPLASSIQRPNTLHLFGVDSLRTEHLFDFFHAFGPSFIEWLDDSSCNIVFPDQEKANTALESLGFDCPEHILHLPIEQPTADIQTEANESNMEMNDVAVVQAPSEPLTVNLETWKAGKLVKPPGTCFLMRFGSIDDKRPDFQTRLKQYNEKQGKKNTARRKNRVNRHEPYKRRTNPRIKKFTATEHETPLDSESKQRAKRFGGLISSIITDNSAPQATETSEAINLQED